jgi:hypothetical protein
MKALSGFGLFVLGLGVLSLFVPIPSRDDAWVRVADLSAGITAPRGENTSLAMSAVIVMGGAAMLIAGRIRKETGAVPAMKTENV